MARSTGLRGAGRPAATPGGFALPVAILAIVVVGMLVTGGFYVVGQERRLGAANEHSQLAFYMAERGIADAVDGIPAGTLAALAVWDTLTVTDSLQQGMVDVRVTRTGPRLYFFEGTGRVNGPGRVGGAVRRLGMVARLSTPLVDPPAALATTGALRVGGAAIIDGSDATPAGWERWCDPLARRDAPGIVVDRLGRVAGSGTAYRIEGHPPTVEESSLVPGDLLTFGEAAWDDLVAMADVDLAAALPTGSRAVAPAPDSIRRPDGTWACDTSDPSVWGDPRSPSGTCGGYFPVIHAGARVSDPLEVGGRGAGQGILLVDGDVRFADGFEFYGPVVVRGTFRTGATGARVEGGVIAAAVAPGRSEITGDSVVRYSSCAVERALLGNPKLARMRPIAERHWVDLTTMENR